MPTTVLRDAPVHSTIIVLNASLVGTPHDFFKAPRQRCIDDHPRRSSPLQPPQPPTVGLRPCGNPPRVAPAYEGTRCEWRHVAAGSACKRGTSPPEHDRLDERARSDQDLTGDRTSRSLPGGPRALGAVETPGHEHGRDRYVLRIREGQARAACRIPRSSSTDVTCRSCHRTPMTRCGEVSTVTYGSGHRNYETVDEIGCSFLRQTIAAHPVSGWQPLSRPPSQSGACVGGPSTEARKYCSGRSQKNP